MKQINANHMQERPTYENSTFQPFNTDQTCGKMAISAQSG